MEERLNQKTHEIAQVLKQYVRFKNINGGLLSGKIGIALFFVHYAKFTGLEKDEEFTYELIQALLDDNYNSENPLSYSSGISGLGWFLEHLNAIEFADIDTQEVLGDFDAYLCAKMNGEISSNNYDFLHGGLGISYYLLNRKEDQLINGSLAIAIEKLEQTAIGDQKKISWLDFDPKTNLQKPGMHNLGLAHGIPGILSVLCSIYHKVPSLREKLVNLIKKTTNFILWCFDNYLPSEKITSYFPYVYSEKEPFRNSRLGWCYGDLGVALSLRSANYILNDANIYLAIEKILQQSIQRKSLSETQLFDAGLCHGTAGVAHIYNSFYQQLKLPYLKDTADYWYLLSLEQGNFADGPAGYKSYRNDAGYVNSYGFLEGVAGIGLAYISYLNKDSSWDKSLLISTNPHELRI